MGLWAELDETAQVLRVIVADDDPATLDDPSGTLVGVWEETRTEPLEVRSQERYAGPGMFHAKNRPEWFAPRWVQPSGAQDAYPVGAVVFDQDELWSNVTADNVWQPGVAGWWREDDVWVQPTGAHDAYPKGHHVMHNAARWLSELADNVWEPGVSGWMEIPNGSKGQGGGKGNGKR